jgi:hypothetical protein
VKVTLKASDTSPGSGVKATLYNINANPYNTYSAPFTISSTGAKTVHFYSYDVAGNVEGLHAVSFTIKASTTTSISSSVDPSVFNQNVTLTAKVTGSFGATPTGTVTFKQGTTVLGTAALSGGLAKFTTHTLTVGSHTITASYAGSGANLASTSPALTQTVNKANTKTTLASSANPQTHGKPVTFTATVTGVFGGTTSGTVKFKDGATVIGSGTINTTTHKATFTTSTLSVGTHSITAAYGGSASYNASTSAVLSQVIN